jgi:hypothetical protein
MRMEPAPRPARPVSRRRILCGAVAAAVASTAGSASLSGCDDTRTVPQPVDAPQTGRSPRPVTGPVLQRHIDLSWLPADYRVTGFGIDTNHEWVTGEATSNSRFTMQADVYGPGVTPAWDGDDWDPWVVAAGTDRVDGRATRWTGRGGLGRRSSTVCLNWQHTSGGQGVVTFTGAGPDNVATAGRIAAGLRLDRAEPVRLPVALRDVPAILRLRGMDAYDPGTEDQFLYRLRYAPDPLPVDSTVEHPVLEIQASPMSFAEQILMSDPGVGSNATMEGHPARRTTQAGSGGGYRDQLMLWEVNGLKLVITVTGQRIRDLVGADAARGVFRQLAVYQQRVDWVPAPRLDT